MLLLEVEATPLVRILPAGPGRQLARPTSSRGKETRAMTSWTIPATAHNTGVYVANDEPSHIHIPRPSRVKRLAEAGVSVTRGAREETVRTPAQTRSRRRLVPRSSFA
jgi:hypothetical protein